MDVLWGCYVVLYIHIIFILSLKNIIYGCIIIASIYIYIL
jgi:hypothetical protein